MTCPALTPNGGAERVPGIVDFGPGGPQFCGHGEIHFLARYLPTLAKIEGPLTAVCGDAVAPLVRGFAGIHEVRIATTSKIPHGLWELSWMRHRGEPAAPVPYISADPYSVHKWAGLLDQHCAHGKPRVGLCWSTSLRGGFRGPNGHDPRALSGGLADLPRANHPRPH